MFITMPLAGWVSDVAPVEFLGVAFPMLIFALTILGGLVFAIYGVVGAVLVLTGKDFHYLFLGSWLRQRLDKQ